MKHQPYVPTYSQKVLRMIRDAAQRNSERDEIDRAHGSATPQQAGLGVLMRTCIDAICCGLSIDSSDEIAEGLAMLVQAEYLVRQLESQLDLRVREPASE